MDNKNPVNGWPGWEIVRLLGKGSFGAVYEIQRDVFGNIERAALKMISLPQNEGDIEELLVEGYDQESITQRYRSYLEDIVREYSLMAEMKGNSNIVDCDDLRYVPKQSGFGWDIYIKMELLTPLTKTLKKEIPEEEVIRLGRDICRALVLCRTRSIVHRDIKPQNIFVSKYGQYKLGDFGIAKVSDRTTSGTKTGTFKYMAPEVYNNQPYGAAADIYSLGIVMYWMLNERRTPFLPLPPAVPTATVEEDARRRRFCGEPIPAPAHGSDALKRIVLKACAFDTRERYESAADMLADLEALEDAGAGKPDAVPAPPPQPEPRPPVRQTAPAAGNRFRPAADIDPTPRRQTAEPRRPAMESAPARTLSSPGDLVQPTSPKLKGISNHTLTDRKPTPTPARTTPERPAPARTAPTRTASAVSAPVRSASYGTAAAPARRAPSDPTPPARSDYDLWGDLDERMRAEKRKGGKKKRIALIGACVAGFLLLSAATFFIVRGLVTRDLPTEGDAWEQVELLLDQDAGPAGIESEALSELDITSKKVDREADTYTMRGVAYLDEDEEELVPHDIVIVYDHEDDEWVFNRGLSRFLN